MGAWEREHAATIVDHATDVGPGDHVTIYAPPVATDLVVELHRAVGERGGHPIWINGDDAARRAFVDATDPDQFWTPEHELELMKATDVLVGVTANVNRAERSDVDPEAQSALHEVMGPVAEARVADRWCNTLYPAPGDAQRAGMSTAAYRELLREATTHDWDQQRAFQDELVAILDEGSTVEITNGDGTRLTVGIEDMVAVNEYGRENLPGGEVFTAPNPAEVDGRVTVTEPVLYDGHEIRGVSLAFEDGEVVSYEATRNEDVLERLLRVDEGASRVGELGFGMNDSVDRFTAITLLDEKRKGTIHLALGNAYPECVPEGRDANRSAVHVDVILELVDDAVIEVDSTTVLRGGTFSFESEYPAIG